MTLLARIARDEAAQRRRDALDRRAALVLVVPLFVVAATYAVTSVVVEMMK